MQKNVLILGITGAFGEAVARQLQTEGWQLTALMRNPARLQSCFQGITVVQGDVCDRNAVERAAENVDVVIYGVNPANYNWENKALPWLDNVTQVVEEKKLILVFPGNVYVLDPTQQSTFDESALLSRHNPKASIRQAMEERLQEASHQGAHVIVLRMGDFFSARTQGSWLQAILKEKKKEYTLTLPGPADLEHTWAYLPDVAKTLSLLLSKSEQLPHYALFHYRGYRVNGIQIAAALQNATGKNVRLKTFPWWLIHLMSPFSSLFRGLWEMRYLWQQPLNLNDTKLRKILGERLPETPMQEALQATL